MAWKGIKHKNVGEGIETLDEWMDEELHELAEGEEFPDNPSEGDFFFKTGEKRLYIYISD